MGRKLAAGGSPGCLVGCIHYKFQTHHFPNNLIQTPGPLTSPTHGSHGMWPVSKIVVSILQMRKLRTHTGQRTLGHSKFICISKTG